MDEQRGGRLRVAVSNEDMLEPWQRDLPGLAPLVIPFAAVREHQPVAGAAARAQLGLPKRARLALFFGMHPGKDPEVTFRAFARLPEWQLVVAGNGAAQAYRRWAEHGGVDGGRTPVLLDGYVNEATRALLHAAVDLMVLSYQFLWLGLDSGGLVDALSWGLPVVCSDRCPAAQVTPARCARAFLARRSKRELGSNGTSSPTSGTCTLASTKAQVRARRCGTTAVRAAGCGDVGRPRREPGRRRGARRC